MKLILPLLLIALLGSPVQLSVAVKKGNDSFIVFLPLKHTAQDNQNNTH